MMPDTSTKEEQPAGMNIEESHVIVKTQPDPPHVNAKFSIFAFKHENIARMFF